MRRRFGRGRRRAGGEGGSEPIDAGHWLGRLSGSPGFEPGALEPVEVEGVPAHFAALGRSTGDGGRAVALAFSPERGSDAVLAALAWGARLRREGDEAIELRAVTPDWLAADRIRLSLLAPALPVACASAPALAESGRLRPEPPQPQRFEPELLAGRPSRAEEVQLCRRALAGLEGLAAKHGGALRGLDGRVELLVLARRAAALEVDRGVRIEVYEPERASLPLAGSEALATALDRLEGLLRKLLNDRRQRGSEGALRSALAPLLERAADATLRRAWPLGGPDGEPVDWVGLSSEGRACVGASRETFDLPALAGVLDGAAHAPAIAAELARGAGRIPAAAAPQLFLAAQEFDSAALDALSAAGLDTRLYSAQTRRNGEWVLEARPLEALQGEAPQRSGRAETRPLRAAPAAAAEPRPPAESGEAPATSESATREAPAAAESGTSGPRFEEVSLFDLDDDGDSGREEGGGRRRRRRRRGRRGRSGEGSRSEAADSASDDGAEARADSSEPRRRPRRGSERPRGDEEREDAEGDDLDLVADDDTLAPLAEDAPDLDAPDALESEDDDEEEADDGEEDLAAERARRERELRRRARSPKAAEPPPPPRRRAAFVAHADRVSVLTAVILARDVRLVESFWVYPQSDLMTFFRSVATDLGEQTPVFLVGFAASPPARDTLQSAALYRGRLDWFDHHDWPPEDLVALQATLGESHVHVQPGAESSLAAVIAERTRRSRFSDKLMELMTGRFTQHDYERWGRWWWHRLGEIAAQPGDRKNDVAPLLSGRPSDLAKAVARAEEPPLPPELAYVSERDFRLVHCGGLSMVVVEVPESLDVHLCARIARERYDAELSLATTTGRDLVVWSADDSRTKRSLDLGGLAAHLATKHAWVEALSDDDHVARVRVRGLSERPDRLDDLIREIAMGRSIIEG